MDFTAALTQIKNAHLYRSLKTLSSAPGRTALIGGRELLLFSSNSYLGLGSAPDVVRKAKEAIDSYGTGAGGSRLTTGTLPPHVALEKTLAAFKGTAESLVFSSGYTANLGALSALGGAESVIFSDALNHASIVDGCRLARARTVVYAHNDMDDLVAKIRQIKPRQGIIVTDSVFSMDGDLARLPELVEIKEHYGLLLMVDDAHATGVLGAKGRGSQEHFGLESQTVDVMMGTLSKAIPSEGGFICGSEDLCDYLRNSARSFIYTTALSPGTVAAAAAAVTHILEHPQRVRQLQENAAYFAQGLTALGVAASGETPIFPVIIGNEDEALRASEALLHKGVFVPCIRYPTVARGAARLRFTLMGTHSRADMDYALDCLQSLLPQRRADVVSSI